jgi:predicted unusual protein kinase regulating ubiquinone biosynthesis (AarF/ABC1/UbiB family)
MKKKLNLKTVLKEIDVEKYNDIKQIAFKYKKKLTDMGIELSKVLGGGQKGIAYDTRDGKVLKITSDPQEAVSAKNIENKKLHYVYQIFKVFQFDSTGYFGILQEKLKPISGQLAEALDDDDFFEIIDDFAKSEMSDEQFEKELFGYFNTTELDMHTKEKIVRTLVNGMIELDNNGIVFADVHGGNIMSKPNGEFVIIDIGLSKSKEVPIEKI